MATMADESKYPTRIAPYGLRMPPELKDRVQAAAEANNRSMNAEIVARLEMTFAPPVDFPMAGFNLSPGIVSSEAHMVVRALHEIEDRLRLLEEQRDPKPADHS